MNSLLLGIDIGTTVVKAATFELDGRVRRTVRRDSPVEIPRLGWSEADMERLWDLVQMVVAETVAGDGDAVAAISLSAVACGAWLVDARGDAVRRAILWNDGRAADLIAAWQESGVLGEVFRRSGNALYPGYTVPVIRWLHTHERDTLDRASWVLCCKDWIRLRLTGEVATDESDASYMPWDIARRAYDEEIWRLCGIEAYGDRFPPVRASTAIAAGLRPGAARALGLRPDTPVVVGMADVTATTLGAGVTAPGQACTLLGTSCLNSLVLDRPEIAPRGIGITACTVGGRWLRSLVNTAGTLNLDWFIDQVWSGPRDSALVEVEAEAARVPIGAEGVLYHPYLNTTGVVSPFVHPHARAQFFGLSVEHTRAHLARAIYEGVALAIRDCFEAMPDSPAEIRLAGGGARSPLWCQMIADCTGRRLYVPVGDELGALGAALLAGIGSGIYRTLEEAAAQVTIDRVYEPRADVHEAYTRLLTLYRSVATRLAPEWTHRHEVLQALLGGGADGRSD